jgi:hypothetical protein
MTPPEHPDTAAASTDGGAPPGADPASAPETSAASAGPMGEETVADPAMAGVAEPAAAAPMPQTRAKTKGVADLVFLIDVSGSMAPCIDALRRNIEVFIDTLSRGDANNAAPVKDWRGKVVGYRDIDSPSTRACPGSSTTLRARRRRAQGAARALQAAGGGDEPESLLDALYKVATMEAAPRARSSEDPGKWRYRSDAARVVVVFTDASFKETLSMPEAKGGSLQDVANVVMANRIILSLFAPNFEGYDRLSQIDKSEWEVVEFEGLNPQEALQKFTSDPVNFRTTLKQLAASVSRRPRPSRCEPARHRRVPHAPAWPRS